MGVPPALRKSSAKCDRDWWADLAGIFVSAAVLVAGLIWLFASHGISTTSTGSNSVWDRVFTDPFLDLLRISLVVLGAFLAGGIVQRAWMADFRFKAGPLELKEVHRRRIVETQTAEGVDILTAALEKLRADVKKNELGSIEAIKKLAEAVEKEVGEIKTQVASIQGRLPPEPPGE